MKNIIPWLLLICSCFICGYFFLSGLSDSYKKLDRVEISNKIDMFEIHGEPFDITANIIITQDTLKAFSFVRENTDSSVTIEDFRGAVGVTFTGEGCPTIWFPSVSLSPIGIATINHELMHLVFYILDRAGVYHSIETDEVYAYELDYLSIQLYNHIK